MKKFIFPLMVLLAAFMMLGGCGNTDSRDSSDTSKEETSNQDKGTRTNPYQIGDTITLKDMNTIYSMDKYKDAIFELVFTVDEAYSPQEGVAFMNEKYDTFTAVPAAKISFELNGNYDDKITWSDIFYVSIITEDMEPVRFINFTDTDDLSGHSDGYTATEYTYYVDTEHDTSTGETPTSKYLLVEYKDKDNNNHSVYVSLESDKSEAKESDNLEEVTEEKSEADSTPYGAAVCAEDIGYLKIAENLYEEAGDEFDARDKYTEIKNELAQYDGTYYGDSTQYEGVKVYIYIQDGLVKAQFETRDISPDEYELYIYGENSDGSNLMAFSPKRTDLYKINTDTRYGDGFAIESDGNGGYIIAATEGSTGYAWNGLYEKISDSVEAGIFE